MDIPDFSFMSLDPGPWSSASSRNNSPRWSMKQHHHLHRPTSSSRGPDASQPSTPAGSEGGSLTACDLAIIAGGINKHGSQAATSTARTQSPRTAPQANHAELTAARTTGNHITTLPLQTPVSGPEIQADPTYAVSALAADITTQEAADLCPGVSCATAAPIAAGTSTAVQGHSIAVSAGRICHQQRTQPAIDWRVNTLNRQHKDMVDHLIDQYHHSSALNVHMHLKTQKHITQLRQYQQLQSRLQATQAAMFASLDSAQWTAPPTAQEVPPNVSLEVQQAELTNAQRGSGSPSVPRFHSSAIMQDGMYVASGDTAFAASPGIKHTPSASLLFERYASKDTSVPSLHRYYFRPERRSAKPQPHFASLPRKPFSTTTLPNGIPVSRLKTEAARRMSARADVAAALNGTGELDSDEGARMQYMMMQAGRGKSVTTGGSAAGMDSAMQDAMSALRTASRVEQNQTASRMMGSGQQLGSEASTSAALVSLGAAGQLGSATAEPLLDDPFAELVKAHFQELAEQQTQRLQKRLNAGLPVLLQSMGVSAEAMTTR